LTFRHWPKSGRRSAGLVSIEVPKYPGSRGSAAIRKKLTLSLYQWLVARDAVHLIEIECFSDRHFWHGGYDKAD
jgi:hypothetical protein